MTVDVVRDALLWCSVINIALLLWWFLLIMTARRLIYRLHSRWFRMSEETFDAIHYAGILFFKVFVFVFNVIPYCALLIVG